MPHICVESEVSTLSRDYSLSLNAKAVFQRAYDLNTTYLNTPFLSKHTP